MPPRRRRCGAWAAVSAVAACWGRYATAPSHSRSAGLREIEQSAIAAMNYAALWRNINVVTLTFATGEYEEVVLNWCVALRRTGRTDGYAVAALDDIVRSFLSTRGLPVFPLHGYDPVGPTRQLWPLRTRLLTALVDRGVSVVVCDADAVWVRDPLPHIFPTGSTPDIVAMRGSFPPELQKVKQGGAQVNMGFAAFRAGWATGQFLRRAMLPFTEYWGDDQKGVNYALYALGARWGGDLRFPNGVGEGWGRVSDSVPRVPAASPAPDRTQWGPDLDPDAAINSATGPGADNTPFSISVLLLPYPQFARRCEPTDAQRSTVMHCFVPGEDIHSAEHKLAGLDQFKLRFLRRDWAMVNRAQSAQDYLQNLDALLSARPPSAVVGWSTPGPPSASLQDGWARLRKIQGNDPKIVTSAWAKIENEPTLPPTPIPPATPPPPAARMRQGLRVSLLREFRVGSSVVLPIGSLGTVNSEMPTPGRWQALFETTLFGSKTKIVKVVTATDVLEVGP